MRRIIVEQARRKHSLKHGGQWRRQEVPLEGVCRPDVPEDVLAINEALDKLATENPTIARLVELRFFAGLSPEEAASVLCVSTRTVQRYWVYAKSWLLEELRGPAH